MRDRGEKGFRDYAKALRIATCSGRSRCRLRINRVASTIEQQCLRHPKEQTFATLAEHFRKVPTAGNKLFQPSSKYLLTPGLYFNIC
jgi:hypothetical protein